MEGQAEGTTKFGNNNRSSSSHSSTCSPICTCFCHHQRGSTIQILNTDQQQKEITGSSLQHPAASTKPRIGYATRSFGAQDGALNSPTPENERSVTSQPKPAATHVYSNPGARLTTSERSSLSLNPANPSIDLHPNCPTLDDLGTPILADLDQSSILWELIRSTTKSHERFEPWQGLSSAHLSGEHVTSTPPALSSTSQLLSTNPDIPATYWQHQLQSRIDDTTADSTMQFADSHYLNWDQFDINVVGNSIASRRYDATEERPLSESSPLWRSNSVVNSRNPSIFQNSPTANKITDMKWENTFISSHSSAPDSDHPIGKQRPKSKPQRKQGRRQGPLDPAKAKRAIQIRRIGACWSCWLLKSPCSPELICHRCEATLSNAWVGRICNRAHLSEYTPLFFPTPLVSHLQEVAVEKLMRESILSFSDSHIKLNLSSGPIYPPIILSVREFLPKKEELLAVQRIDTSAEHSVHDFSGFVRRYTLPLALPSTGAILLKGKCRNHIKSIVSRNRDRAAMQIEFGEMSMVSWKVYLAIHRYSKENDSLGANNLLQKAMMLQAMHYFMGRNITIVDGSGQEAFKILTNSPLLPYDCELASKILVRQVKHAMYLLLQDTTREVLESLEKELKTRAKTAWAPCFCTILILCFCTEELQVAIDGFLVQKIVRKDESSLISREDGFETTRKLDELLYTDCKTLFHGIYRSFKMKKGPNSEQGFNPIRDGVEIVEEEGSTQVLHNLIEDIHEILGIYENDMIQRAKVPSFDWHDDVVANHMIYRERNSGRLVSDFLRSFLESAPQV